MNGIEKSEPVCVAIIPARGGSKRIPGKNIRPFAGRPMIEYAVELARSSGLFVRVVVSTDSDEVTTVAEQAGAEVPFRRPAGLADDHTTTAAVLAHALDALDGRARYDYACCIYPATPFTTSDDLHAGLALVADGGAASSFAVAGFAAPIWRAMERGPEGNLSLVWPEHRAARSQDLPETFHDAGQFYWVPVDGFLDAPVLLTDSSRGVIFERWRAHDIDTEEDWVRAEAIYQTLKQGAV
ncbi:MAG: pseudaminic acid cytidylyltransferase [Alphaproteobacteria bacterium]